MHVAFGDIFEVVMLLDLDIVPLVNEVLLPQWLLLKRTHENGSMMTRKVEGSLTLVLRYDDQEKLLGILHVFAVCEDVCAARTTLG